MKQSAVSYLVEKILLNRVTDYEQLVRFFNVAAEMETKQIIEAYESRGWEDGNEYYNENFKQ